MRSDYEAKLKALDMIIHSVETIIATSNWGDEHVVHHVGNELTMLREKRRLLVSNYAPLEVK